MATFSSSPVEIRMQQFEPQTGLRHPALVILHGSGGAVSFWLNRLAPRLLDAGVAAYAPHYFDKTGTERATAEMIFDGRHFHQWLNAVEDAVGYVAARPAVDSNRIGVLGISLGGFLAVALATQDSRVRALVEVSGGVPHGWESRITSAMPATLALHGAQDSVVPVSEALKLQQLLAEQRVPNQVEILPGEGHWFSSAAQMQMLLLMKHL
jgi:carboxymethylenebutenolidase